MRTILLGPQRFTVRATSALRSLDTTGPLAVVNAGWEEREDDIAELDAALDHRMRGLRLYHRLTDVLTKDREFARAASRFRFLQCARRRKARDREIARNARRACAANRQMTGVPASERLHDATPLF